MIKQHCAGGAERAAAPRLGKGQPPPHRAPRTAHGPYDSAVGASGGAERDPVSTWFDRAAREFLDRVYARPGQWVGTRVPVPTDQEAERAAGYGIDVRGRDQLRRPRFAAAFVRSAYYQAKWHRTGRHWHDERRLTPNEVRSLRYEVGRWMPRRGLVPAGYAVRFMSKPGGEAARKAVAKMPDSQRIYLEDGEPGPKWADPVHRDW